jgi:hypothetical protein
VVGQDDLMECGGVCVGGGCSSRMFRAGHGIESGPSCEGTRRLRI